MSSFRSKPKATFIDLRVAKLELVASQSEKRINAAFQVLFKALRRLQASAPPTRIVPWIDYVTHLAEDVETIAMPAIDELTLRVSIANKSEGCLPDDAYENVEEACHEVENVILKAADTALKASGTPTCASDEEDIVTISGAVVLLKNRVDRAFTNRLRQLASSTKHLSSGRAID